MLTQELTQTLMSLPTREEIHEAWEVLRRRSQQLSMSATVQFQPGQRVRFEGRRGRTLEGVVQSLNKTTITVAVQDPLRGEVKWRVGSTLLTPV